MLRKLNPFTGCYPNPDGGTNLISYLPPVFLPGTLCYTATPSIQTHDLGAFNSLPQFISFGIRNVVNFTDIISVSYGSVSSPFQYTCAIDPRRSTPTKLVCLTQSNSQVGLSSFVHLADDIKLSLIFLKGLGLRFTVVQAGISVTSTDTLNFPSVVPELFSVTGCPSQLRNSTFDCPTSGQVTCTQELVLLRSSLIPLFPQTSITLRGQRFFEPISVLVNGADCPLLRPTSANRVVCQLAGTAFFSSLFASSRRWRVPCSRRRLGPSCPRRICILLQYTQEVAFLRQTLDSHHQLHRLPFCQQPFLGPLHSLRVTIPVQLFCSSFQLVCLGRNVTLTVTGSSFGSSGALVFIGTSQCSPVWHDPITPQTILRCRLPAGQGSALPVQVFQKNGELSLDTTSISYVQCPAGTPACLAASALPRHACSVAPRSGRFDNGASCVDCGFGRFSALPAVSVCGYDCSSMRCSSC